MDVSIWGVHGVFTLGKVVFEPIYWPCNHLRLLAKRLINLFDPDGRDIEGRSVPRGLSVMPQRGTTICRTNHDQRNLFSSARLYEQHLIQKVSACDLLRTFGESPASFTCIRRTELPVTYPRCRELLQNDLEYCRPCRARPPARTPTSPQTHTHTRHHTVPANLRASHKTFQFPLGQATSKGTCSLRLA